MAPLITLLTDFGLQDTYVAQMHAVILGLCPGLPRIDLTHAIPRQDIAAGARQLAAAWRTCPAGTVHCAVVDPGVGSKRRVLALQAGGHRFVGPDNGLLIPAASAAGIELAVAVDRPDLYRQPLSRSFHGRDIFAPIAAHLARGLPLADLGPRIDDWIRLQVPAPSPTSEGLRGRIVHIDIYGNCTTDLPGHSPARGLRCAGRTIPPADSYSAVAPGEPLALIGSDGNWEIAINQGDAAGAFDLHPGSPVDLITPLPDGP